MKCRTAIHMEVAACLWENETTEERAAQTHSHPLLLLRGQPFSVPYKGKQEPTQVEGNSPQPEARCLEHA